MRTELITLLLLATALLLLCGTAAGERPNILDVAKNKPVKVALGDQGTCGTKSNKRSMYCFPPDDTEGYRGLACEQKSCETECAGREKNPDGNTE